MGFTLQQALSSFKLDLKSRHRSDHTVAAYTTALRQFDDYLGQHDLPRELGSIITDHVRGFLVALAERRAKPATIALRAHALQQFFKWAEGEDDLITCNPMDRIKVEPVPEGYVEVPPDEAIVHLLATCEGKGKATLLDRRDAAILRVFVSTGIRRGELAKIQVDDLDLEHQQVLIRGKGGKDRLLYLGSIKAVRALDRYLRARAKHPEAASHALWLGGGGRTRHFAMTGSGIYAIIRRRAREAGLGALRPHQLRHKHADLWLSRDALEGDLKQNMGWSPHSRQIWHYARARASARAREATKRMGIGDEF